MIRFIRILVGSVLLTMALVACGGRSTPTPSSPQSSAPAAPSLTQTVEAADEFSGITLTARYPEGWVGTGDMFMIMLANSAEAQTAMGSGALTGEHQGVQVMHLQSFMIGDANTLEAVYTAIKTDMEGGDMTVGEGEAATVAGNPGLRGAVSGPEANGFFYVSQVGDEFIAVLAAAGEITAAFQALADAIAASVTLTGSGE